MVSPSPDMTGLPYRNLQYTRSFAAVRTTKPIVQQAAAQLPWGHLMVLIDKLDDPAAHYRYAEDGWSRNGLIKMSINTSMERSGAAPSSFSRQLPSPYSELAQQVAKDPGSNHSGGRTMRPER